jgi:hypothetical protein
MFITEDGCKLFFQSQNLEGCRDDCDLRPLRRLTVQLGRASGIWVDSLDPELQDNFWYGDDQGPWDVDSAQRLDGKLLDPEEEINHVIDYLESLRDKSEHWIHDEDMMPSQIKDSLAWAIGAIKAFKDNSAEKVKLLAKISFMETRMNKAIKDANS